MLSWVLLRTFGLLQRTEGYLYSNTVYIVVHGKKTERKTKKPAKSVFVDKPFVFRGKVKQDLAGFWPKDTYQKIFLWGRFARYVLLRATKTTAATNSVLPVWPSDGHSLGRAVEGTYPHHGWVQTQFMSFSTALGADSCHWMKSILPHAWSGMTLPVFSLRQNSHCLQ